jgi:hypothetical protein
VAGIAADVIEGEIVEAAIETLIDMARGSEKLPLPSRTQAKRRKPPQIQSAPPWCQAHFLKRKGTMTRSTPDSDLADSSAYSGGKVYSQPSHFRLRAKLFCPKLSLMRCCGTCAAPSTFSNIGCGGAIHWMVSGVLY